MLLRKNLLLLFLMMNLREQQYYLFYMYCLKLNSNFQKMTNLCLYTN